MPVTTPSPSIPTVHIHIPNTLSGRAPELSLEGMAKLQVDFQSEVEDERQRIDRIHPTDRSQRFEHLRQRYFLLQTRRHKHDHKESRLMHCMGAGLILTMVVTLTEPQTIQPALAQGILAVAATLFLFTAWSLLTPRIRYWRQASRLDPSLRTRPVVETPIVNGRPAPHIRPIEVRIAAFQYLLAVEKSHLEKTPD